MQSKQYQHQLKIVASSSNAEDFCKLLEVLSDMFADVRNKIEPDSLEIRKVMTENLDSVIENIQRVKRNLEAPQVTVEDD